MQNTIYEYEEIKEDLEDYKELKNHIINTTELHDYFKLDWKKLKAKQYCGILNFNNQDFYILPKIANHNDEKDAEQNLNIFIYMLMYAYDVNLLNENTSLSENLKSNNILEVFVQMFANGLLQELKKGMYKKYITEQDNLSVLKGKYLINENLKYNFTKNKIYCEYDEFSPNNSLNQFFLYAVKYLQKFVKDKKLLKQCELIFDEVEYKSVDINKLNIHFDRLNLRFKTSFEIAILLLKQSIPLFNQDKKSFAFLFDMNVLFEKFIARIVKEIENSAKIQNNHSFGDLILKPDILLENQIIDTKYKKLKSTEDIKQSDKLQAFAYGVNYIKDNVMLLYPKHLDEIKYDVVLGKDDKKVNLRIRSIDLNFDGNDYKKYIDEIRKRMEMIL
ncbi:McrC family protein [Aliarcobacter cryaerophilus]|uniref:McrC family protein n=1 Tax=Aliarcobacter cryaerophilus TaxID=28198 RepID=UPI003DA459B3